MIVHDYLIDHTNTEWSTILQEWRWLLPTQFGVWILTRAGDLFIAVPEGTIHMLDVGAGELRRVADHREDFYSRIDEPDVAKDWLMTPIVDKLVASGATLGPGQCYSYRILPTLGGSYAAENRMVFSIREHFGGWGSVQRQIAELPEGSEVIIKPVC